MTVKILTIETLSTSIKIISILVDTGGIWTGQRFVTCTTSFQASCVINISNDATIGIT